MLAPIAEGGPMQNPYDPYQPPRQYPGNAYYGNAAMGQHYGPYQPLGWKTTVGSLGIMANVVLGLSMTAMQVAISGPPQENIGLLAAVGLLGLLSSGVSLVTVIVYLLWTHQAAKNVRAFGQQMLEFTPGWAVGWWFIPFASLWLPYKALREIWRASDPETVGVKDGLAWPSSPVPSLFPIWWGTYLASGAVSTVAALSQVLTSLNNPGDSRVAASPLSLVAYVFQIVAAVAIFSIMKQLDRRQEACAAKLQEAQRTY